MAREVCGICWCPYDENTGECACEPEPKKQHMTTLRTAAQQALEALEGGADSWQLVGPAIDALKAALAEQRLTDMEQKMERSIESLKAALAEPDWQDLYLKEKKRADMWRDKYESVAGAEQRIYPLAEPVQAPHMYPLQSDRMRIDPVTGNVSIGTPQRSAEPVWVCPDSAEHRYQKPGHCEDCGKTLVQVAEPVQKPVPSAWRYKDTARICDNSDKRMTAPPGWVPLYSALPQRKPLTKEEIDSIWDSEKAFADIYAIVRAIERAHNIT